MEIEIRAKISNTKNIQNLLSQIGAKLVKEVSQIDRYYGAICLYKKLGYTFLLRVRYQGKKAFLTYKGAKQKKAGVWEEYEFPITEPSQMENMLSEMGLDLVIEVHKHRLEYTLNNFAICIDEIKGLGTFVEVELQTSDKTSTTQAKAKIQDLLTKLNINKESIIHEGYVTLLLKKNKTAYSNYIVN